MLITLAIVLCIYQIVDKLGVLMKDPLTININLSYEDKMEFPVITICNTLKVRVSHITKGELLLKLANFLLPRESQILWYKNLSSDEIASMENYGEKITARDFYKESAVPLEETVLWCKLPDGRPCTIGDFQVKFTDGGVCFQLTTRITTKEGGQDKSLKLLLNLAQYERVPDTDPSGLKIIIHEKFNEPMMSNGYEVMAGYRMNVVLRKTITKQHANCAPVENSLRYFERYSYLACRRQWRLEEIIDYCKCKPYTLESHVPNVPDCSLLRQMKCVDRQGGIYEETESSTLINTHVPPCIGECTIIDYDKELSYATFRDRSTFKNMLGDEKMKRIKRVYENGHESATLVNIIRKNDPQIEELQIIAAAYQNLIVDRKIVPPYGSILDKFLAKHPCLKNHFVVQTSAEYNSRSFLKSIFEQFNPQLFDQLIDNIQKLEIKLQLLNLDHLIHLAENVSQAYFEACSAQNDLLCGLSVIYDLIEVRKILSSKYNEIESIQKEFGDEFSRLVAIYRSQNDSKINQLLPNLENYTLFDDESNSTVMLISYLGHVTLCLKHLYQIYGRQLANGQPSFKTKDSYKSFLTDLRLANFTIHFFCNKKSGEDDENPKSGVSMINPKNDLSKITGYRKALAKNLIQELVNTNRSLNNLLKEARFNVTILSFLDELKILDDSTAKYESGVLQQSLYDMNMFSRLVKTYLNQTVNSRITKNMFYEDLVRLNAGFQQGMTNYKHYLHAKFKTVRDFLTTFLQNLFEIYAGDGKEAEFLRYRTKIAYKSPFASAAGFLMADDPLILHLLDAVNESATDINRNYSFAFLRLHCLLEMEQVLISVEKESGLDLLDETRKLVDRTLHSLKAQIDDVEQMKGFFQENLGLVNIYFRDLGVKETAQERAYDFFSFLCDVGGSIGLWLGASMLSLVELLDLCLYPRLRRDYARIVHGELLRRFGAKGDEPVDSVLVKCSGNGPSSFKTALVNPRNGIGGSVPYLSDDDDNVSQAHLLLPRKGSKYLRLNGQDDYWEDRSYTNSVYYDALESLSQLRSNDSDTLYSVSDDRDSILG